MRNDQWATSAPVSFAIAGVIMLGSLASVVLTTQSLAGPGATDQVEATNLNSQAEGLLRLMLESPGYVNSAAWGAPGGENADALTRLGLLTPGSGLLDQTKFENLRMAEFAAAADGRVNYAEARGTLGLDTQGLDFHIRAYPSLLEVQQKLAKGIKDTYMRVGYIGHVEGAIESGAESAQPLLGVLECTQSPYDSDHYQYQIDIGRLNQRTHLSVSLGIKQGGTGLAVEAADVTEIAPSDAYTTTFKIDVPNTGNVGCDATTEVAIAVSDQSATLITDTLTPTPVGDMPTGPSARNFLLSTGLNAYKVGDTVSVSYTGASKDDTVTWKVYKESDPLPATAVTLTGVQKASPITVINPASTHWFAFEAPPVTDIGFYRIEATHTPSGGGATETSVRRLAVHDGSPAIAPYTGAGGPATAAPATDAMMHETRWIHDLSGRFCAQGYDDATFRPMHTEAAESVALNAQVDAQCNTRINNGFGGFPALNTVGRSGDIYYDTKDSAASLCRILLADQLDGECDWQNGVGTLEYLNVLVIGSDAAHNNLVDNDFKRSVPLWIEAGGTLIVLGSTDSRQWMQSGLGIGHVTSSGPISSPDTTHPSLNRPNPLDWENYGDTGEQWGVDEGSFTSVIKQGDAPVTAVSNSGSYGKGSVFLTSWRPYDIYGTGAGASPDEGRMMLDNMMSMSYRDLYMDYGPPLPSDAPAVPALGHGLINHDKLGLIEMDFVMYVFRGAST